ncbi:MAG: serine/threonine-protein kinase [Candidatus Ozemobacteraceae bacterium]
MENNDTDNTISIIQTLWHNPSVEGAKEGDTIKLSEEEKTEFLQKPDHSGSPQSRSISSLRPHKLGRSPGKEIDSDFELLSELGKGGMGVVYKVRQTSIDREIALKMIKPEFMADEIVKKKFLSEALVTGELDHPNIVPIHELGTTDEGNLFYAMKQVKGKSWKELIKGKSQGENLETLRRVCDAVAFAHSHGVIHRDLKPENVMLGDFGEVMVMDWGLAASVWDESKAEKLSGQTGRAGTPTYMSPEMARSEIDNIGFPTDVYLLGGILYEIVTGLKPHHGANAYGCICAAAKNEIQTTEKKGELVEIALKAMSTKPADRFATVKEFQQAIQAYQSHLESLNLVQVARKDLEEAKEDYQTYARAVFGFEEALKLWPENREASEGVLRGRKAYAECALKHDDLDLASNLILDAEEHVEIRKKIDIARTGKNARQKRLGTFRFASITLGISIFFILAIGYVLVSRERDNAKEQERNAKEQEVIAKETLSRSDFNKAIELFAREKSHEAVAYLVRALRSNRANKAAFLSLFQNLFVRNWPLVVKFISFHGKVDSGEFSSDGRWLVTVSADKIARIWEIATGKPVVIRLESEVNYVVFSPNGRWIVTVSEDKTARIWETETAKPVGEPMHHAEVINFAVFSPDSRWLVTASENTARLWETAAGKPLGEPMVAEGAHLTSATFSPDGQLMVLVYDDRAAFVRQAPTGKLVSKLIPNDGIKPYESSPGAETHFYSAVFSPDSRWIVTVCDTDTASVWESLTGKHVGETMRHGDRVVFAVFSPDSRWIVTASEDKTARVWEAATGKPVGEPMHHGSSVSSAVFSPDSHWVVTASFEEKTARVWEAATGKPVCEPMPHNGHVTSAKFNQNGQCVLTTSDDNTASVWEIPTGKQSGKSLLHVHPVHVAVFSPDGRFALTACDYENSARVWDAATGKPVGEPLHHESEITSAAFSPDSRWVVTSSLEGKAAQVWEAATGKPVGEPMRHDDLIHSALFSPDGKLVVTTSDDKTARIWEAATGKPAREPMRHDYSIYSAVFSPDGHKVVTSSYEGKAAQIWDADTGKPVGETLRHDDCVNSAVFSPDGRWVVTASNDTTARVWDASSGKSACEPMCHDRVVRSAVFSPDGRLVVTASNDKTARVWETATAKPVGEPMHHERTINSAVFSSDGRWVVTASDDNTARVWESATGKPVGEPVFHEDTVNSAAFSPDGRWIITASNDKTAHIRLFDPFAALLPSEEFLLGASRMAGVQLNQNGAFEEFPIGVHELREKINASTDTKSATVFAKWLLSSINTRPTEPFNDSVSSSTASLRTP